MHSETLKIVYVVWFPPCFVDSKNSICNSCNSFNFLTNLLVTHSKSHPPTFLMKEILYSAVYAEW